MKDFEKFDLTNYAPVVYANSTASPVQGAASMSDLVQSKQGEPARHIAELTQGAASAACTNCNGTGYQVGGGGVCGGYRPCSSCSQGVASSASGAKGAATVAGEVHNDRAVQSFKRAFHAAHANGDSYDVAVQAGLDAALAERAQAAQPTNAVAEYTPGKWFDARTVDEMQEFYLSRLPAIREAAKEHGYAIGLHGSTRRDFDLMAMQWRDNASDKDTLARAIVIASCGLGREGAYQWEQKPSGRFAVSMPICWTDHSFDKPSMGHIDLSVIEPAPGNGMRAAADFIDKRAEEYLRDNASNEHDTGATIWHFGDAGRDYHSGLVELADDLRAATPAPEQEAAQVAPPGAQEASGERADFAKFIERHTGVTAQQAPTIYSELLALCQAVAAEKGGAE